MKKETIHRLWERFGFYVALLGLLGLIGFGAYALGNPPPAALLPSAPVEVAHSSDEKLTDSKPKSVFPVRSREILMARGDAVWSETLGQYQVHEGVDIRAAKGEKVYAALSGEVREAGRDALLGHYLLLAHEDGILTRYAGLAASLPESGQRLEAGAIIGEIGEPGPGECALPPHLHFEAWKDGTWVDLLEGTAS